MTGLVAALTLRDFKGTGFDLLVYQVRFLNALSSGLGVAWGIGVTLLFLMAQITILDAAGKLIKRVNYGFIQSFTSSHISQFVGGLGIIVLSIGLVVPTFSQPGVLLKISAVVLPAAR